jgi:hypothetical protein
MSAESNRPGKAPEPTTIGWREWVRLPELGDVLVKAKVDTGARTSTLHAYDIEEITREGEPWLRFSFHPNQRDELTEVSTEAPLIDRRSVTPSSGTSELRYVVSTIAVVDGTSIPIELTLTRRDEMGFRMLLGRSAMRGRFIVDPRRSYRTAESRARRKAARKERAGR